MKPCVANPARPAIIGWIVALATLLLACQASQAQNGTAAAWRVECGSDGKVLDCRALLQLFNRDDKQLVAQLTARMPPDSKMPSLLMQLPLGINLVEPVQLQVDAGPVEKQTVQTCTTTGCFVGLQLNDKLLASMRSGTTLKVTFYDTNKRGITLDVPLLGFGLALDKTK
jgi:invasion protein IalB